jgi:hypothetical protein
MPKQTEKDEPTLDQEVAHLKKRVEALEARVTELEKELRETQEAALAD